MPEISGTFVSDGTQHFFLRTWYFSVSDTGLGFSWADVSKHGESPGTLGSRSLQADFEDLTLRSASCLTSDLGPFGY